MKETIINAQLTDREVDMLQTLNDQTELLQAIRKVMLMGVQSNGVAKHNMIYNPMYNWAMQIAMAKNVTNQEVGETTRAVAEGLNFVELAFKELCLFKVPEEKEPRVNKAV